MDQGYTKKPLPEQRKTFGQHALEVFEKGLYEPSPIELQRAMQRNLYQDLIDRVLNDRKLYKGKFFVVVLTKSERLFSNAIRTYTLTRHTCPTPNYDQTVFRYNHLTEQIEFIWTIPDRDTCFHLMNNMHHVHKDEHELLNFIVQFHKGQLWRLMEKLNGEKTEPSNNKEETV